jgi:DNA-binding response OmpR family regulator
MENVLKILLIEDDNDDIELLQNALQDNGVTNQMYVIKDGGLVAGYLETTQEVPDIIVMDFNLPKVHGRDILKHIKQIDSFQNIPLIILTTSSSQDDIAYSYKEGANKYLIKPTTIQGINNVIEVIIELAANE